MAQTKYTYSIANDTLNGGVNEKLSDELNATAIVTTLDRIDTDDDVLDIYYADALSEGDETILTNAIAAHDNTKKEFKIYGCMRNPAYDKSEYPCAVNFKTDLMYRLHPKNTFTAGVLTKIEYYKDYDGTTYSDKILEEIIEYTYDSANLATSRTTSIYWYYTDESQSENCKTLLKYYTPTESIQESQRRRQNILDSLQLAIVGLIMQTESVDMATAMNLGAIFLDAYEHETKSWIITPNLYALQNRLNAEVTGETDYQWLFNPIGGGLTVRDYMLSQINY